MIGKPRTPAKHRPTKSSNNKSYVLRKKETVPEGLIAKYQVR